ncbi:MAG: heme-binding protein, partial [Methanofollis sp.]|nr:heme-binding protein [Methanofollis sp.]
EGLEKAGVETVGEVFLMRYNPPWVPGFLRRNEVGIEIRR